MFTIKQSVRGEVFDYTEFAMIWRESRTPELSDFKAYWGDLFYIPFHEHEEIVELVPKEK
jgi:hypothetical protein